MSKAKITIMGMEAYLQSHYQTSLFAGVNFPADIDREFAINTIIFNAGEFEVLYSNADFLKEAITLWSNTMQLTFKKWAEAFKAEFSPIENYDRYDEYKDVEKSNSKMNTTSSNNVSAYNSSVYQPKEQDITGSTGSGDRTLEHELHSHGNIGVTRSSEMMKEYIELYGEQNIYTLIADDFISKFCIMVY